MFNHNSNHSVHLLRRLVLPLLIVMAALVLIGRGFTPIARAATSWIYPSGSCNLGLQVCINNASNGDTILITTGSYVETFTLNKAVSLIADGGVATFDGQNFSRV